MSYGENLDNLIQKYFDSKTSFSNISGIPASTISRITKSDNEPTVKVKKNIYESIKYLPNIPDKIKDLFKVDIVNTDLEMSIQENMFCDERIMYEYIDLSKKIANQIYDGTKISLDENIVKKLYEQIYGIVEELIFQTSSVSYLNINSFVDGFASQFRHNISDFIYDHRYSCYSKEKELEPFYFSIDQMKLFYKDSKNKDCEEIVADYLVEVNFDIDNIKKNTPFYIIDKNMNSCIFYSNIKKYIVYYNTKNNQYIPLIVTPIDIMNKVYSLPNGSAKLNLFLKDMIESGDLEEFGTIEPIKAIDLDDEDDVNE